MAFPAERSVERRECPFAQFSTGDKNKSDPVALGRRSERFVGTRDGERFWGFWIRDYEPAVWAQKEAYTLALMTLCGKYGRLCIWGDGNSLHFNWNRLLGKNATSPWHGALRDFGRTNVFLRAHRVPPLEPP